VVAEHAVLSGRHELSVKPEHGPGAVARNARTRYAQTAKLVSIEPEVLAERFNPVEQRDLAVYEQILEAA
jgi:hypothetical protein